MKMKLKNWNKKPKPKTKTKKDPIVFRKLQEEDKGYLLIVYRMCELEMLWSRRPEARVWEVHQGRMKAVTSRYQQHRRTQPSSSSSRAGAISRGHLIRHRLHRFLFIRETRRSVILPPLCLSVSLSLARSLALGYGDGHRKQSALFVCPLRRKWVSQGRKNVGKVQSSRRFACCVMWMNGGGLCKGSAP